MDLIAIALVTYDYSCLQDISDDCIYEAEEYNPCLKGGKRPPPFLDLALGLSGLIRGR